MFLHLAGVPHLHVNRPSLAKQQLCTCITLFCTFLCRRCTARTWNCLMTFFWGREHKTTTFYFLAWTLMQSIRIQLQKRLPTFDEMNEAGISAIKCEEEQPFRLTFSSWLHEEVLKQISKRSNSLGKRNWKPETPGRVTDFSFFSQFPRFSPVMGTPTSCQQPLMSARPWGRSNKQVSSLSSERSLSITGNRQDGGLMADKYM